MKPLEMPATVLSPPTAQHSEALAHVIPSRPADNPASAGELSLTHEFPSQRWISGTYSPELIDRSLPTAQHCAEVRQVTPFRYVTALTKVAWPLLVLAATIAAGGITSNASATVPAARNRLRIIGSPLNVAHTERYSPEHSVVRETS